MDIESEVRKAAAAILNRGVETDSQKRGESQAQQLVRLLSNAELFHTPDGAGFASVMQGTHRETWPLRSKSFKGWWKERFYREFGKPPNAQAFQDALGVIEAQAQFDGPEYPVHIRIAGHEGRIYVDLCNNAWQVVEIDAHGWRVVNDYPVRFRRTPGMLPLTLPVTGGEIAELRQFVNVDRDSDWLLLVGFLVGACHPAGPYPILNISGEQGSAKSTAARIVRRILDPGTVPLRSAPKDEHDLMIAAKNAWLPSFDNMSALPAWLADAMCRLATGGGFATRELYTDDSETLFDAKRPVILNGIENFLDRPDLADRALVLTLPAIPDTNRRTEVDLWKSFDTTLPRILGALYTAVSVALKNLPSVTLPQMPRMADFATWVTAAEPGLGWKPRTFLSAYCGNRDEAVELALESDVVAMNLCTLMATAGTWQGSAKELLEQLNQIVGEAAVKKKSWPETPRALSGRLRRNAPLLRRQGINITFDIREGRKAKRVILIEKTGGDTVCIVGTVSDATTDQYDQGVSGGVAADGRVGAAEGRCSDADDDAGHDRQHVSDWRNDANATVRGPADDADDHTPDDSESDEYEELILS